MYCYDLLEAACTLPPPTRESHLRAFVVLAVFDASPQEIGLHASLHRA